MKNPDPGKDPLLESRSRLLPRLKMQSLSRRLLSRMITLTPGGVALLRKPFACATGKQCKFVASQHASSAVGRHPKRITFASPNRARSAARSVTNTQSLSAASITGSWMVTAMKPRGGPALASILCLLPLNSGGGRASRKFPYLPAHHQRFAVRRPNRAWPSRRSRASISTRSCACRRSASRQRQLRPTASSSCKSRQVRRCASISSRRGSRSTSIPTARSSSAQRRAC
jgi:hypothetical protein